MVEFGWSLPAGCTTLPGEEPEAPDHICCPDCGQRLDYCTPTFTECFEEWEPFDPEIHWQKRPDRLNPESGDPEVHIGGDCVNTWVCPSCGCQSQGQPVYWDEISDNMENLGIPEIFSLYRTFEEWEDAASPLEVCGLPETSKKIQPNNSLLKDRINGNWYFVCRTSQCYCPTQTVWVNGLGDELVLNTTPYYHDYHLNGVRVYLSR